MGSRTLRVAAVLAIGAGLALLGVLARPAWLPGWFVWLVGLGSAAVALNELLGKPAFFLRWSVIRMGLGARHLMRTWQVGDGREQKVADFVVANARAGDVDHAIQLIDEFGYRQSFLMNVGDEKGEILDAALRRSGAKQVLEVGAYVGYSALRIARQLPSDGHVTSVEFSAANAALVGRIIDHAGMGDRITFVVGSLGDGGKTFAHLREKCGFAAGTLDFVFLDHDKDVYLSDLLLLLGAGWLHPGSVVVADNIRFPGAPEYRAYMKQQEGGRWETREHEAHVEYQSLIPDLVLESTLIGPALGTRSRA